MENKKCVFICTNVDCSYRGAREILKCMEVNVIEMNLNVTVKQYMCFGNCQGGPNIVIYPDKIWYSGVKLDDVKRIVEEHLKEGKPVEQLTGKVKKDLENLIYPLLDFENF